MKGVYRRGDGRVVVEEVPAPAARAGAVVVRVAWSLISSGTESHSVGSADRAAAAAGAAARVARAGTLARKVLRKLAHEGVGATLEAVRRNVAPGAALSGLGYSAAGRVVEVGEGVDDLAAGDLVACAGAAHASHQELICVPRNLVARVPDGVAARDACFATLGGIALHAVRQADVRLGETVLVIGLGLVGQLVAQVARAAGCRTIGTDLVGERVRLARELGCDAAVEAGGELARQVGEFTGGLGADAVLICADTPSSGPVQQALACARDRGRVVVVGAVGLTLVRDPFYKKELSVTISRSYGPGRYDPLYEEGGIDYPVGYVRWTERRNLEEFLRLVASGSMRVAPLVGLEVPLEAAPRAYEALGGADRPIAALIAYPAGAGGAVTAADRRLTLATDRRPAPRGGRGGGAIRVAVAGCGGFAQSTHLPNLNDLPGWRLRAVVASDGTHAREVGTRFGAEYCTTEFAQVLADPDVDAVVISTRHNQHQPMALAAVGAGKAVFLEKPMALSWDDCTALAAAVREAGVPFTVGFNRRYSPLAVAARDLLRARARPYVLVYRVNAGRIGRDHWVQDPDVGGGRILGEACHFFDLFNYLVGEQAVAVQCAGVPVNTATVECADSLAVTVQYRCGSTAVLVYTGLGSPDLPKERLEIAADGASLVLDDFSRLTPLGFRGAREIAPRRQEKGWREELVEFGRLVRGEPNTCLTVDEALEASRLACEAHALAQGRRMARG
jgi:predicted dehydrogenase/threonine dehydrogenase-like Zn-dependent dehydrogenase